MSTFTEGPRGRPLTAAEQKALAKVENGYVHMNEDGELLIIDDTAHFRGQDEERRQKELATVLTDSDSENDLAHMVAEWPMSRLVEAWNSLPGVIPVKRFADRKAAIARIWKAAQALTPAPAAPELASAPRKTKSAKRATQAKEAPTARDGSKKAQVLKLLQREDGATLHEIMKATDWQAHTIRGFISGSLTKKMGLKIAAIKRASGDRAYSVAQ